MQHQKPFLAGIIFLASGLSGCDSTEIGESRDVNQDRIFLDYRIYYTEGEDKVSLSFQYRFAGSAGTTLVLTNPSQAALDGEKLKADSSEGSGAFYAIDKNFNDFTGKHQILFTDINGKHFDNIFEFVPFGIKDLPAAVERNKDLVINYISSALNLSDHIELNIVDTGSSFHIEQTGSAGSITIPSAVLLRQKENTLTLENILYREIPLLQTTPEGGSCKLYYRLKPVKIKLQP